MPMCYNEVYIANGERKVKIAIVGRKNGFFEKHIGELDRRYPDAEIELFILSDTDRNIPINPKLKEIKPDVLLTEDLVRFDESTLTDGISYNLLDCRQIHIIFKENIEAARKYMSKQLSLAMHFFCADEKYIDKLMEINPDIPFIEVLPEEWTDVLGRVLK